MESNSAGVNKVSPPLRGVGGESDSGIFGSLNCMQVCCDRMRGYSERFREREGWEKVRERAGLRVCAFVTQTCTRTLQPLCQESSCCRGEKESSRAIAMSQFTDQYRQVNLYVCGYALRSVNNTLVTHYGLPVLFQCLRNITSSSKLFNPA